MKVGDMVLKKNAMKWYVGMFGVVTETPSHNSSCVTWSNGQTYLYLNHDLILISQCSELR